MADDSRALLALQPVAKELMKLVKDRLPPGTHFGIFILAPGEPEGRFIAICTDRQKIAPNAAAWFLDVHEPPQVIHILMAGLPLCLFNQRVPAEWPKGHSWVDQQHCADATCADCRGHAVDAGWDVGT